MATNQIVVTGNLGVTPVVRNGASGTRYGFFSLAHNERYRSRERDVRRTNWFQVIAFDALAETLVHLTKGARVTVVGRLRTEIRYREDGTRYTATSLVARSVDFLDSRRSTSDASEKPEAETAPEFEFPSEDDIPF